MADSNSSLKRALASPSRRDLPIFSMIRETCHLLFSLSFNDGGNSVGGPADAIFDCIKKFICFVLCMHINKDCMCTLSFLIVSRFMLSICSTAGDGVFPTNPHHVKLNLPFIGVF
jgi:hypothetical protein